MPISLNSASSPNVRASSGTMGTTRLPILSSRTRLRSRRANAIVVDTDWLPDPRRLVRGVELLVVVAAARQVAELVVGQVLDHLAQARVGAEEVLADVRARLDRELLELAVDGRVHLVEQHAVGVAREELVPLGA